MGLKTPLRKKLLISGIAIVALLYIACFMPLPFIDTLWESHTLRHRMTGSITRSVVGLHEEDIVLMLGESEGYYRQRVLVYRVRSEEHQWRWQHLVIFLDENGLATDTIVANPAHVIQ